VGDDRRVVTNERLWGCCQARRSPTARGATWRGPASADRARDSQIGASSEIATKYVKVASPSHPSGRPRPGLLACLDAYLRATASRRARLRLQFAADTVRQIADRDGVMGLILARHQMNDGVRKRPTKRLRESVAVICRHIDCIEESSGPGHVALETDRDGFIKPMMGGLETAAELAKLPGPLLEHYRDEANVDAFLYGNARRVVEPILTARKSGVPGEGA
jgi:Membrane dipeptidase (Peptidase family M19)